MKKTVKKLLAVLLAVSFIFLMSTIAFAFDQDALYYEGYEKYYKSFPDVAKNAWYYEAVSYCSALYITGYKNGNFGPADNLQRQDFAVMLLRFDELEDWEDAAEYFSDPENFADEYLDKVGEEFVPLSDIPAGQYYSGAVNACYAWGYVTGYQNGKFGVGDKITREQVVTMLFRYEWGKEEEYWSTLGYDIEEDADEINEIIDSVLGEFPDAGKVSSWAKTPMVWAVANGIITGKNGKIAPQDNITRAEVATILTRMDLEYLEWSIVKHFEDGDGNFSED
ncbi:MAG: S-layer homology domain-containing protein [Clostridiaceae bacterium]|nr:S-layer homology domain-containing protein [Clostridiaceae bacterium]